MKNLILSAALAVSSILAPAVAHADGANHAEWRRPIVVQPSYVQPRRFVRFRAQPPAYIPPVYVQPPVYAPPVFVQPNGYGRHEDRREGREHWREERREGREGRWEFRHGRER